MNHRLLSTMVYAIKAKEIGMPKAIGIDAGGTLTKVAYLDKSNELVLKTFPSNDLHTVKEWIINHPGIEDIGVTGDVQNNYLMSLKQ